MSQHPSDIRFAAQTLYDNIGTMNYRAGGSQYQMDMTRSHSINLITEDFLGGYSQDGRMSVVRRFFCLFVTFDLFFISLLWLICILITGDNIYNALKFQVLHYTITSSIFDVVMAALCRFVVLILFYALLYINHWFIIALSTSGSCLFLISKVFFYDWVATKQPVFHVVLILMSFVLAWGEAWFLDCRVIPQERYARGYFTAITSNDRSPLIAPFLTSNISRPPESVANFYSPFDSAHNSDDEDGQDDEYRKMGVECVRRAYQLLQLNDWKIEKVTQKGDTIQSKSVDKLKIYRLTARVKYPAKKLLEELFYKIEEVPRWNPTLLESKIVKKIDSHTDISYQATVGGGGGIIKSRDFVNLRCWRLCRDGKVIEDSEDEEEQNDDPSSCQGSLEGGSVSTISDSDFWNSRENLSTGFKKSTSEAGIDDKSPNPTAFQTLSKSLGARDFLVPIENDEPPPFEDEFSDARDNLDVENTTKSLGNENINNIKNDLIVEKLLDKVYISAAVGIEYSSIPINPKYIRGENLVGCWAMREIEGKPDVCIFEWLLCLDLKGYIPRYVLNNAYTTLMQEYMIYLRKYCKELRLKRKKVPKRMY